MTLLPKVKLKALVSFPATVLDGTGIDIAKSNGTYQFNLDFGDFAPPTVVSNLSNLNALLWNSSTGQYTLATAASLTGTGGGAPPSGSSPLMNGVAAPGIAVPYSREDHVHPSDTSRAAVTYVDSQDALKANLASPVFTGNPTAPTPAAADNDTSIATTAFITNAAVRVDLAQSLSAGQKAQAQNNIFKGPTTQSLTASGTYTTPTGVQWIEVFMVGGGGGGAGASNSGTTTVAGSAGGTSIFNSINANGGSGGAGSASAGATLGGAGGTGGTGTATRRAPGSPGGWGYSQSAVAGFSGTGKGGDSYFGGGANSVLTGVGNAGTTNTGAGGGGGQASSAGSQSGAGGGAGEFVYLIINGPAASYSFTIGSSGAGGVSTNNGGAGGSGFIFVIEHYGS